MYGSRYLSAAIILAVSLAIIGLLSSFTPYLEVLELKSYDFMMATIRGPLEPPSDIAIVAIDEDSISEFSSTLKLNWPWPRSVHGELIAILNEAGVKAIVFDITFFGESRFYGRHFPEEDAALAESIRQSAAPVVLAAAREVIDDPRFFQVRMLYPLEALVEAGAKVGFATLNRSSRDPVIRQARLSVAGEPTLVTQTLNQLDLALDPSRIPVASYEGDDPQVLINYAGGARSIPTASYYQAIDYKEALPEGFFQGKMVFVGSSLTAQALGGGSNQADMFPSPFASGGAAATSMPGVEIHANTLNTVVRNNFIRRLSPLATWGLMLLLGGLITALVLLLDSLPLKIGISLSSMLVYFVASSLAFAYWSFWMYTVQPLAVMLVVFGINTLHHYRASERERIYVRRALKGYVSPQVLEEVLSDPGKLELGGKEVTATVLFSDIADFSTISEGVSPAELAHLLNNYFTRMGDAVMKNQGMINKYIGDSIMAIWGAPLASADHAVLACRSALEMKELVRQLHPLATRIGINTGPMVAGNLGHQDRMEYTVIGDSVNLASRLEGANKVFGTGILISESTEALVRSKFAIRPVDLIRVVGKERPVRIFEVLAQFSDSQSDSAQALIESFSGLLRLYQEGEWSAAVSSVLEHIRRFPDDPVASVYLERCQRFARTPPEADWDGVVNLESK